MQIAIKSLLAAMTKLSLWVCIVVIVSFTAYIWGKDWKINKESLYLKKQFAQLDLDKPISNINPLKIAPYKIVQVSKIESKEILESLGTEDYLQCTIIDESRKSTDPLYVSSLFLTYYTGDPDAIPHVPDECYLGNGWIPDQNQNIEITVPKMGIKDDQLPLRVLTFKKANSFGQNRFLHVGYYFSVDGSYSCTRRGVQLKQANMDHVFTYFSKVEVSLPNVGELPREKVISAMEKILKVISPVLLEDHWPDWQAAIEKQALSEKEAK